LMLVKQDRCSLLRFDSQFLMLVK